MASGLRWTSDTLTPGLKSFPAKLDAAVGTTMEYFSPRVEGFAKSNAPWTDRTGNARNSLNAHAEHVPLESHAIEIAHGMPYGIWLEVRNSGRYAIIQRTIKEQGREVMAVVRQLFARIR